MMSDVCFRDYFLAILVFLSVYTHLYSVFVCGYMNDQLQLKCKHHDRYIINKSPVQVMGLLLLL